MSVAEGAEAPGQPDKAPQPAFRLGAGLVTGASDDDPSGIATYSQAGAQFGYGLLWTLLLTFPLMAAVQIISAQIGRVTGCGLAKNMQDVVPRPCVFAIVGLLFVANTINVGADLAAMGAVSELMVGWGKHGFTIFFALFSLGLQLFVPYHRYAKYMTLVVFAYVAVVFAVGVDWADVARGLLPLDVKLTNDGVTTIVAILGTTISPFLFFWQSSQEVEEAHRHSATIPLKRKTEKAAREMTRIRFDTFVGMAVSNVVGMAIMISAAATLHLHGKTDVATASDAAAALRPIAGDFAFLLFSVGIVGTGLLAVPVMAGSGGYAAAELCGWTCGLENKPHEAMPFYGVIVASTLLGIGIDYLPLDPMKALFWSGVINGFVAAPVLAIMMWLAGRGARMGSFKISSLLLYVGWATAALMAGSAVAMLFE
ncbi:MAG TPA: divalent metal cation transporter [Alphaproteobacteria bacterium]